MLSREDALRLLKQYLKNDKLIKHCLAVGAIMRAVAGELGEDENLWELVGLLHDIDYEIVGKDLSRHGLVSAELLEGKLPDNALHAIKAHNELTGVNADTKLALALRASDHASGLIIATALVMPHKRLEEVRLESLLRKFKQKDFARNIKRERILSCEKIGLSLDKFLLLALEALQNIHGDLGL